MSYENSSKEDFNKIIEEKVKNKPISKKKEVPNIFGKSVTFK